MGHIFIETTSPFSVLLEIICNYMSTILTGQNVVLQ